MPDQGLDEDKLAALLRWGTGLQGDPREEVAAAGRAIVMLVEEVERLHVLAWGKLLYPATEETDDAEARAGELAEGVSEEPAAADAPPPLFESLRRRLRAGRDAAERGEPETVGDEGLPT